ncbi:MAG: recombinase family protein, partial [Clostridia bacterium]|nr:recombinase family protein [Clostridia bacterium]
KGITGTSVKNRDEFNKMIKLCKRGKVDMIITKSISRFARNTLDCLKYTRMLKAIGVDVFFEEQGIHSTQPGAEFYITIYGSIAQSESENISANVKFGKAQSAREGNVAFHYKNFLGYRKGEDGKPEIVPEEAETIRFIYESFLAGDSFGGIKAKLEEKGILSPSGTPTWRYSTIQSILTNEKYAGDAIINKTYIEDCISKKVKVNNGERQKFYVENNHPAIIDRMTFARVQEELARRNGKLKVKQVGTKTEQGKYSSKYALTELLVCGECKTPYRRCTWTVKGKKKIVWRCINRLDYGKKYCHESPTVEESVLQEAIMNAIMRTANENAELLKTLKLHIGMGLDMGESEDESLDLQIKIAEIDAEFKAMLNAISSDTVEAFDEQRAKELMDEKSQLQQQLAQIAERKQKRENTKSRLDEIFTILDGLRNRPMEYDDRLVRQILECVVVESKERIKVVFIGGLEITETLINNI